MDIDKMARGVALFLDGLGGGFEGDDLEKTPERVARAWRDDLVSGYGDDPASLVSWTRAEAGTGPVMVRDIRFASICVHHLLPFSGVAHVAYLPAARLAGLSKIGRVVDAHARRLQTQEHLGESIVTTLEQALEPRGVLLALEAEHTCMTLRGVRKEQSRMLTLASRGVYRDEPATRAEVLTLLTQRRG
jgi:GTP cyclohydrolase I